MSRTACVVVVSHTNAPSRLITRCGRVPIGWIGDNHFGLWYGVQYWNIEPLKLTRIKSRSTDHITFTLPSVEHWSCWRSLVIWQCEWSCIIYLIFDFFSFVFFFVDLDYARWKSFVARYELGLEDGARTCTDGWRIPTFNVALHTTTPYWGASPASVITFVVRSTLGSKSIKGTGLVMRSNVQ